MRLLTSRLKRFAILKPEPGRDETGDVYFTYREGGSFWGHIQPGGQASAALEFGVSLTGQYVIYANPVPGLTEGDRLAAPVRGGWCGEGWSCGGGQAGLDDFVDDVGPAGADSTGDAGVTDDVGVASGSTGSGGSADPTDPIDSAGAGDAADAAGTGDAGDSAGSDCDPAGHGDAFAHACGPAGAWRELYEVRTISRGRRVWNINVIEVGR